jgi:hypothetical protein
MNMTFNLSLTQIFAISVLVLAVVVPVGVFASPIFETGTAIDGNFYFEPEQSIANPFFGLGQVSDIDVVVMANATDPTLQEVFVSFRHPSKGIAYLTYTNNEIENSISTSPYFVDVFNNTSTVLLNENDEGVSICNVASQPKVSVTDTHVFASWLDFQDSNCDSLTNEGKRIAAIAISKSSFADIRSTAFFDYEDTAPAYFDAGSAIPTSYSMTANGTNAYITWENSTSVNFIPFDGTAYIAGVDSGVGFGTDIILDSSTSKNPDVVADGSNVFVAWQDGDSADKDIKIKTSSDNGVSFGTETDVSGTNSVDSTNPKLSEDGGIVYVSWLEGTGAITDQVFVASSGNGYSPVAVSTNAGQSTAQQIIADGPNVFAVWQDNIDGGASNEILFSNSTDSGVTFGTPINLSESSGDSVLPKISGDSNNVNIVWRDDTFALDVANKIDGQVWFKSYDVTSASLSGLQVVSEATTDSTITDAGSQDPADIAPTPVPNISSTSDIVIAVWNPDFDDTDISANTYWDGSMKTATPSTVDISFNSTEYLFPRNATITVVDAGAAGSGTVTTDVLRGSSTLFADKTLVETGPSTGIFSNTFEIHNSTFGGNIGDIFTANYTSGSSTITTQAMIQDDNVFLDFLTAGNATGAFTHDIGDIVGLIYNNTDGDTTGASDTIDMIITSDVDSIGTTITLTETGPTTGLFNVTNGLIFMDGALTPSVGDSLTITKTNSSGTGAIDIMRQNVTTTSNPAGVELFLTETGATTDVYTANISICDSSNPLCISPNISGVAGDFISISDIGGTRVSNGMILPDNTASRDAILVSCGAISCGQVTATYNGLSVSINVEDTLASGGGGGGVSRAGLVVNALAGLSSIGSGSGTDGSAPIVSLGSLITNENFDIPDEITSIVEKHDPDMPLEPILTSKYADFDMPLTINDNGYPLGGFSNTIQTFSTSVGDPITISSLYYEQTALQHVSMYLNLRDNIKGDLSKSDTQILYNKDKELVVIDPNGFFDKVSVNVIEDEDSIKKFAEFEITFAKPMDTSDIALRSWDDKLRSMDTIIYDAIQVIGTVDAGLNVEDTSLADDAEPESVESLIRDDTPAVPEWVKNNAEWWSQGDLDDTTFKNSIGYLIQEGIIDIPTGPNVSIDTSDLTVDEIRALEEAEEQVVPIPEWVKNNAEWWYQGSLSEDEFLTAIEYLVKEGIIEI